MLFWQPIMQRRRQEQRLVHIRGSKALSHGRILTPYSLWKSCYVWCFCRIYSRHTPRPPITFGGRPLSQKREKKGVPGTTARLMRQFPTRPVRVGICSDFKMGNVVKGRTGGVSDWFSLAAREHESN